MRVFFFVYLISFLLLSCRSLDPDWISERPKGYTNDYFVGIGESKTSVSAAILSARANAAVEVLKSRRINISADELLITVIKEQRGKTNVFQQNIDNVTRIVVRGNATIENFYEEENYVKSLDGIYQAWSLVKTPKPISLRESPPTKSDYLVRSFIPGWGQFYKGEPAKGYFIAGGTAVLLTSGFVFSNLKTTAESDAKNSRTQALRDYYNDNTNTYNNISLACIIAAAAVYIYNVVDAVAAEGEKVYVYEPQNRNYELTIAQTPHPRPQNLLYIKLEF